MSNVEPTLDSGLKPYAIISAALSFSTFKLALSRHRRPVALGVAVLVIVTITAEP
jgi:hypothetical protein